jgi:hypothetical protein
MVLVKAIGYTDIRTFPRRTRRGCKYSIDKTPFCEAMGPSQLSHPIQIVSCCITRQNRSFLNPARKNDSQAGMYVSPLVKRDLADGDICRLVKFGLRRPFRIFIIPFTSRIEFFGPGENLPGPYPRSRIRGRELIMVERTL